MINKNETLLAALRAAYGPAGRYERFGATVSEGIEMPAVETGASEAYAVVEALKDDSAFAFHQLSYMTATDEWTEDSDDAGAARRFRIIYFLLSLDRGWRVKVHTRVPETGASVIKSVVPLFMGANWMEREIFDMFGVRFAGHPELRRILMPEGYEYYPLRKDFPLDGIQPDRLYRNWERERENAARAEPSN